MSPLIQHHTLSYDLCYILQCAWVLAIHFECRKSNCCFNSSYLQHGTMPCHCYRIACLQSSDWFGFCACCVLFGWENGVCWWAVGLWGPVNWIKGQHLWGISQESQLTQHVLSQVSGVTLESQLPVFVNRWQSAFIPFVMAKNQTWMISMSIMFYLFPESVFYLKKKKKTSLWQHFWKVAYFVTLWKVKCTVSGAKTCSVLSETDEHATFYFVGWTYRCSSEMKSLMSCNKRLMLCSIWK